jgi:hypothetical protein
MSVSTSPPPPPLPAMEKNSRRVRFSLPEAKLTLSNDKRPVHGTSMYVNGTLINVTSTIHSTTSEPKTNGGAKHDFKSSLKIPQANGIPKEASHSKVTFNIKPPLPTAVAPTKEPRHSSLPTPISPLTAATTTANGNNVVMIEKRRMSKSSNGRQNGGNTLPLIGRKSSSVEDFDEPESESNNLTKYKSSDDLRDPNNFKMISKGGMFKLPDTILHSKALKPSIMTPNTLKVPEFSESKF